MDTKYEMNIETFTDQKPQAMLKFEDRFEDKLTEIEIQTQHQNAQYAWLLADLDTWPPNPLLHREC